MKNRVTASVYYNERKPKNKNRVGLGMRLERERGGGKKVYLLLVEDVYSGPQTVAVITRRDNGLQNTVSV